MKIALIHPVRTAGQFITEYCRTVDPDGIRSSWDHQCRDWTRGEMLAIATDQEASFVACHSINWSPELIVEYQSQGWTVICGIRHVGEQLSSLWHSGGTLSDIISLDEFIIEQIEGRDVCGWNAMHWALFWPKERIGGVIFIENPCEQLPALGLPVIELERIGTSANPGWLSITTTGQVSEQTAKLVTDSIYQERYESLCNTNQSPIGAKEVA